MVWRMPAETAPQSRIWMAFPREGDVMGDSSAARAATYEAWTAVAHAILPFEPVTMVVDPSEVERARAMLDRAIDIVEAPLDDFWMRDFGPTFVIDDETGALGGVDWIFNAWGQGADCENDALIAERVIGEVAATRIPSLLVNEGGGIHVDGEGTVLVTETVQLDPDRNPWATKERVEEELKRTLGVETVIWLPRGLTRDYDELGTRGHVDIVATFAAPGRVLVHAQHDPAHPDHDVMPEIYAALRGATDARGRALELVELPAPAQLTDDEGFVDYSYVNHLVVNGGVIACGFGDEAADARAREILSAAYPGRTVVTVDAREIFARGGGIHCITQQQPAVASEVRAAVSGGTAGGGAGA